MIAAHCSFCGATSGPFVKVEGLFTVLMCADCQAARGHGSGPYSVMTRAEMRAGLNLMPTWALQHRVAANRQVIAIMRRRLAAGEEVARMTRSQGCPGWSDKPRWPRSYPPGVRRPGLAAAEPHSQAAC